MAGIKEALAVGTKRAVASLSRKDACFDNAIRDMTLEDVCGILGGGGTPATEFFRRKTATNSTWPSSRSFRKRSARSAATRACRNTMARDQGVPLKGGKSLDLDDYVTNRSASTRATCSAGRPAPSAICCRQLVPSATIKASGAARTAGSRLSSAICIDTAWWRAS